MLTIEKPKRRPGRPPFASATFDLPLPPPDAELGSSFAAWREQAMTSVREAPEARIGGLVSVTLRGSCADVGREWLSLLWPVGHILVTAGVVDALTLIGAVNCAWSVDVPRDVLRVEVRQLAPLITRDRMVRGHRRRAERLAPCQQAVA
jgi:hypothetical protein